MLSEGRARTIRAPAVQASLPTPTLSPLRFDSFVTSLDNPAAMPPPKPAAAHPAAFPRSFRKSYPVAARGEGIYIYDAAGKPYLDFDGSAAVNFFGHGVREIAVSTPSQPAALPNI